MASRGEGRWAGTSPGVSIVYEPGSIFKLVTASAALNEHRVRPDETFFCYNGSMRIPGGVLHDAEPLGDLTLGGILAHSSNIGISQVALRLGPSTFERYIRAFGFGKRTGIDFPGESRGFFRSSRQWSKRSIYTIAMGQEIGVTPIQLATAVSAIANGGMLMRPYIVSRVLSPDGKIVEQHRPVPVRRVISPETSRTLLSLLTGVVSHGGTGESAAITGFDVAGKTGTANRGRDAWFVAISPTEVVLCWIGFDDNTPTMRFGAQLALPIASALISWQNVSPPAVSPPADIVFADIDRKTGLLADSSCGPSLHLPFLPGTVPQDSCTKTLPFPPENPILHFFRKFF
jgi:cell division protein FtsI/penicillin-binding protein 2